MVQFLTNRMSDTTYLKDVDDRFQDFEDAIVYAFGLPTDTPMTGAVMGVDADGNITSILRSAAAANQYMTSGPGWRSRDTANSDEYAIGAIDGYLRIFENTGSQASPLWAARNKLDLSDGTWDVVSSADIGTGCAIYGPAGAQDFRTASFMHYQFEFFDDGDYFDAGVDETKLVIPAAGRYNVQWSGMHDPSGVNYFDVELATTLYLNGSPVVSFASGTKEEVDYINTPYKVGIGVGGEWTFNALSQNDYLQFQFEIWSFNDLAFVINHAHAMIERIG
jgi:hypothetical protein